MLDVRSGRTRRPRGLEATAALVLVVMGWWVSGAQGCPTSKPNSSLFMGLLFGEKGLLQKKICMLKSTGVIINSVPAERLSPRGQFRQKHTREQDLLATGLPGNSSLHY